MRKKCFLDILLWYEIQQITDKIKMKNGIRID